MTTKRSRRQFPSLPAVEDRPLIGESEPADLMRLFKVFANDTRLRLLHALVREEEMCVNDLTLAGIVGRERGVS